VHDVLLEHYILIRSAFSYFVCLSGSTSEWWPLPSTLWPCLATVCHPLAVPGPSL